MRGNVRRRTHGARWGAPNSPLKNAVVAFFNLAKWIVGKEPGLYGMEDVLGI